VIVTDAIVLEGQTAMSTPRVVGFYYTLKDDQGDIIDQSGNDPLHYLEGANNIIPGLEKELVSLQPGDKKNVVVVPEEAYGIYQSDLSFAMNLEQFGTHIPEVGQVLEIGDHETTLQATVSKVEGELVHLDANHPLAGKTLHFDIEIVETRPAEQSEVAHGHPHVGAHHH